MMSNMRPLSTRTGPLQRRPVREHVWRAGRSGGHGPQGCVRADDHLVGGGDSVVCVDGFASGAQVARLGLTERRPFVPYGQSLAASSKLRMVASA
jgi:hypothetical protein